MSPSYSSYTTPKRRSPQMAAAARMMPGATYSLRKNSVCSVSSYRCVMAISQSKRGVSSVNCMSWVGSIQLIFMKGCDQILSCMILNREGNTEMVLGNCVICMESINSCALRNLIHPAWLVMLK